MNECRYHGQCRIEFDTDFDVCYPCIGDWGDTCAEYKPMPDVGALLALADEMQGYADVASCGDGFPYVNAGSLWSYADRIREALGVES